MMKASNVAILMVAVFILALVPVVAEDDDAADPAITAVTHPVDIKTDTVVYARGDAGEAVWSYERTSTTSVLTISGGKVSRIADWEISAMSIDGEEVTSTSDIAKYEIADFMKSYVDLHLGKGVTADPNIMRSLNPRSVSFASEYGAIPEGMFKSCGMLTSINFSNVTSIGKNSFQGCIGLKEVDILTASVDPDAFNGCNGLKNIKAAGSKLYYSDGEVLYTDGKKTIFMYPTGVSGMVSSVMPGVTKIMLGNAPVTYVLDNISGIQPLEFETIGTDVRAKAYVYSSIGMESCVPSLSANGSLVLKYMLHTGWMYDPSKVLEDGLTIKQSLDTITLTLNEGEYSGIGYPMGKARVTYEELRGINSLDGWLVSLSNAPAGSDIVKDVDPLKLTVKGYDGPSGDVYLGGTMSYYGVICHIEEIKSDPGSMGNLENLTVGEGITIGDEAFANSSSLRSITANYVKSVGVGAFRYCTNLMTANFNACTEFGDYAFESCWSIETMNLGASKIEFGKDALRGCRDLGLLTVGWDSVVTGAEGVTILHYDTSVKANQKFDTSGDFIRVYWDFASTVKYSTDKDMSDVGSERFYYDDRAIIPKYDEMYIQVSSGNGEPGYKIVFDPGLGLEPYSITIPLDGDKLLPDYVPDNAWGYDFLYWNFNGNEYDPRQPVSESMILTAEWAMHDEVDPTPMYIGVIFLIAVIASSVIIGIARREQKRY